MKFRLNHQSARGSVKTIKPNPSVCLRQFGEFAQTTGLRPLNSKAAERLRYARANNSSPALNVF
jgi:hypothetical protein